MNLFQVAHELAGRLIRTFTRDASGRRPVFGGSEKFQTDPHWRDCILFYEYFHGDNGAGIGASHQTGWTGAIARVIQLDGVAHRGAALRAGRGAARLRSRPALSRASRGSAAAWRSAGGAVRPGRSTAPSWAAEASASTGLRGWST